VAINGAALVRSMDRANAPIAALVAAIAARKSRRVTD
jgi:hypothetical protein